MDKETPERQLVKSRLENVIYPVLDKNICELKTIEKIDINGNRIVISLNISNKSVFEAIENQIIKYLSDHFKEIEVLFSAVQNNTTNFGDTARPNNRAQYAKNIIAVTSGKGGVGKTTISVNLSIALAQMGYSVGLLDADVYGPDTPRMLQLESERLAWNSDNQMIPGENFGIKVMSTGLTTPSQDTALVWRSSVAVSALIQFLEDAAWGKLDFLIIDMPPGTGDIQLTMAEELPITAAVIVTTPQRVSIDDASRAIMMFRDIGVRLGGLVENMSYFIAPDTNTKYQIFGEGGGVETAQKYHIPFLGKIPLTINIRKSSDLGTPSVAMGTEVEKNYYRDIAKKLLREIGIL